MLMMMTRMRMMIMMRYDDECEDVNDDYCEGDDNDTE